VLGIDPGTIKTGVGIVDSEFGIFKTPFFKVLQPRKREPIEKRLAFIYDEMKVIIETHQPDEIAVEDPFVSNNPKTALAIGQAQAVILILAAQKNIPIARYAPTSIKKSVTDYGNSSKEQVLEMVKVILCDISIIGPDDISDALAVAICHHNSILVNRLLGE